MQMISSMWFNTQFTLGRMPYFLRLINLKHKIISPSVIVNFENDHYQVKTADTPEEIAQVLSLRFEVFFREFSTKKVTTSFFPYDVDRHDFICDHLIVKDKATNKIIACYRLLADSAERKIKRYYSEGEFSLDELLATPGTKLELGRACVHKDYRQGTVIALLWKGLISYARKSGVRYMFGCSSLNRKEFENLPHILGWLKENKSFIEDLTIDVLPEYKISPELNLRFDLEADEVMKAKPLGSLMHMYIMAGAKIGKVLAYDQEMDCIDFFTLMDLDNLPPSFERRFS